MTEPTIFARASGTGRAAVAIVRISGPATRDAVARLAGRVPAPRVARLATLRDLDGEILDRGLVLWFPRPHSFTGEDAAELHLHGGRAVVDGVLDALSKIGSLRPAEPGEFTRSAFRNGKMDLTEVEGLADLIEADTRAQRRQALRQLDGALGRWAGRLREALVESLALAEARIDFADEDDLLIGYGAELREQAARIEAEIAAQMKLAHRGERLRDGVVVAIAGAPNVGKSSLLNRLAGREAAIVSAHAGTTRDAIEVDLDLRGYAVRLVDTAGLRTTGDPVEREGILRARRRVGDADLVLWLDDGGGETAAPPDRDDVWTVTTKIDLRRPDEDKNDLAVSAETGDGIDLLLARLTAFAAERLVGSETALVTRLRHREALGAAQRHLLDVIDRPEAAPELVAETLRAAVAALSSLVGVVGVEEVLGGIFARFCIGK